MIQNAVLFYCEPFTSQYAIIRKKCKGLNPPVFDFFNWVAQSKNLKKYSWFLVFKHKLFISLFFLLYPNMHAAIDFECILVFYYLDR